jgi:hypothetical protein
MARHPQPVPIRGITYPSVAAAAKAFDTSTSWIYRMMAKGRLDDVGIEPKNPACALARIAVNINGVDYPSMTAAAEARGVTVSALSHAMARKAKGRGSNPDRLGMRAAANAARAQLAPQT